MKKSRVKQITDLGEWLGTDAESFIRIRGFMDDLEANPSPQSAKFLESFDLVYRAFSLVRKN
jgi:hypothetical protein